MLVYIGQSWHTAGVNITEDRTRVALVGQWIPMYFWGDTELHDLGEPCTSLLCPCSYMCGSVIDALGLRTDTHLLNRMPETTLRCLGVDHRKGNGARDRSLSETSKLVGQTIGRALSGGTRPFVPNAEEGDKVPGGPVRTCFSLQRFCTATPLPAAPDASLHSSPAHFSRRTYPLFAAS